MGTGSEGNTEFQLLLDLRVWWYCPRLILWEGAPVTQAQSPILAPPVTDRAPGGDRTPLGLRNV